MKSAGKYLYREMEFINRAGVQKRCVGGDHGVGFWGFRDLRSTVLPLLARVTYRSAGICAQPVSNSVRALL